MSSRVIAVVVTYNRRDLLRDCLDALLTQTHPCAEIIVINNASSDGTKEMLEADYADKLNRIHMEHNVGGAGGFYRGMKWAYDNNADWVWMMDDDGIPAPDALEQLMKPEYADHYDVLNSLVIDRNNAEEISFVYQTAGRTIVKLTELRDHLCGKPVIDQRCCPFNGTLISKKVIDKIGFIRREMFIWGDEADYLDRMEAAHLRIATVLAAKHRHPKMKYTHHKFGPFGKITITPPHATNIFTRNLGYRLGRNRAIWYRFAKPAVYVLYHATKGDIKSAYNFVRYWIDGLFDRYQLAPSRQDLASKSEHFSFHSLRKER